MLALTLGKNPLDLVEQFVCLGSFVGIGDGVTDEINLQIVKARAAYVNSVNHWNSRNDNLTVKLQVYNTWVRAVLVYACETWIVLDGKVRQPFISDHWRLRRTDDIRWQHHVSSVKVR